MKSFQSGKWCKKVTCSQVESCFYSCLLLLLLPPAFTPASCFLSPASCPLPPAPASSPYHQPAALYYLSLVHSLLPATFFPLYSAPTHTHKHLFVVILVWLERQTVLIGLVLYFLQLMLQQVRVQLIIIITNSSHTETLF